jgi:hypothetical protein
MTRTPDAPLTPPEPPAWQVRIEERFSECLERVQKVLAEYGADSHWPELRSPLDHALDRLYGVLVEREIDLHGEG